MDNEGSVSSKIRIRMGVIEVDFEGTESFLRDELPELLATVSRLHQEGGVIRSDPLDSPKSIPDTTSVSGNTATTSTIATKLSVNSGPELIVAAAARLTFSGVETFSRKQLIDETRSASAYYKKTYLNNLSKYLDTLIRSGRLSEISGDNFALTQAERKSVQAKLTAT